MRVVLTMLPLEKAIIEKLQDVPCPCCFDEVVMALSIFSWEEVFVAADCMSRDGRVCLRQLGYLTIRSPSARGAQNSAQQGVRKGGNQGRAGRLLGATVYRP